jgi:hypothetical protein
MRVARRSRPWTADKAEGNGEKVFCLTVASWFSIVPLPTL